MDTTKLQVTIDTATARVIGEIVELGIHGTSKAEVACSILRMWIWENEQRLRENGVSIRPSDPGNLGTEAL